MGNKKASKENAENFDEQGEVTITSDIIRKFENLKVLKVAADSAKETYSENLKAVAEMLHIKPAVLTERLTIITKEEESGGVIKSKQSNLDFAEKYFLAKDNNEGKE